MIRNTVDIFDLIVSFSTQLLDNGGISAGPRCFWPAHREVLSDEGVSANQGQNSSQRSPRQHSGTGTHVQNDCPRINLPPGTTNSEFPPQTSLLRATFVIHHDELHCVGVVGITTFSSPTLWTDMTLLKPRCLPTLLTSLCFSHSPFLGIP